MDATESLLLYGAVRLQGVRSQTMRRMGRNDH